MKKLLPLAVIGLSFAFLPDVFDDLRTRIVGIEANVATNVGAIDGNGARMDSATIRMDAHDLVSLDFEARISALEGATVPPPTIPQPPSSGYPAGVPLAFEPDYPIPPTGGTVMLAGAASVSLQTDTTYILTGDVTGTLSIPTGSARIVVDGGGFQCGPIVFPASWASSPDPKCSDIVVRNMRRVGGQSGFTVYGERILIENVECREADFTHQGVYSWGVSHLTVRDCDIHTQGQESGFRFVNSSFVSVYRCDVGTLLKHSLRIHGTGGPCSQILWVDNVTSSPWYMGYEDRAGEFLIDGLYVSRNSMSGYAGNDSWFQHSPPSFSGLKLQNLTFTDNTGPGTNLSASNLSGLQSAADATWLVSGNTP